ncbi:SH3 domain-containing protein [Rubellimicrobium rubrum]|uniref:SH3 domain-containing protein n=1 Tax=Rubellimicrobium rubrum TaxID=2585369 RepID=A0A5C4MRM1_9RHOB|nr:SH3 domain-containing protein [Rubellimicrobium rubrum]TNC47588.1 SH3 domain-containing protein [Rubellimicrobium rubrum]
MRRHAFPLLLGLVFLAGCGAGPAGRAVVQGAGPDELVKLRAGPGLGYSIILGLPDGTTVDRRDCVTELGQLWCRVSLSAAPRFTGYVSADYLSAP